MKGLKGIIMKLFCFCDNKTKVETYSKKEIDEKFLGKVVAVTYQRYYTVSTYNPEIKIPFAGLPDDWYDSLGMPNYILVGGYVGSYTKNGNVLGTYKPIDKYLDVDYSHGEYALSGSLQGFNVKDDFTIDMVLCFKKVR